MRELTKPEADFPTIVEKCPDLYHGELTNLKEAKNQVGLRCHFSTFIPVAVA